jgi:CDP-4-dehydro-6-deoxyglucose reductase, E3
MTNFRVELAGSHKQFDVEPNETVLSASRRNKLALPYSCLSGRCGSCSAKVISGRWRYAQPVSALNPEESKDHALLCQALPVSDLVLALKEVDNVADLPIVQRKATLIQKNLLGQDVLQLLLELDLAVHYLAGQYLEFVLEDGKRRPFSIANAPNANGVLELHVRKVAGGGFTQALFEQSALGQVFQLDLPHGTFVPRASSDRPILFVAGGTGFAPVKALLEQFQISEPNRQIHLYWQASFDARYGSVHEAVLDDYPDLSTFDVYMSGPPAMIAASRTAFLQAKLPEDRLYYDSFDFAPDVLAALIQNRKRLSDV